MKKLSLLLAFLLTPLFLPAKTIVLYHTSDTHGFFYPQQGQGGFAALAAVVKQEKLPHLLLDSGDFANGTVETKNSRGQKAIELMNAVGYDAVTVGNHEFDFKDAGIDDLLPQARFAVLAANMRVRNTQQLPAWAQAYQVFEVGGVKVGVIGLANRNPTQPSQKYNFTKPLPALKQALESLQSQQPDLVVVLVHDSLADYKNGILRYLGDISKKYGTHVQVVLGGHAHKVFQNEYLNGVLYAESGHSLQNVTKVTVEVDDKTGQFVSARSELIALTLATVGQDKTIAALADRLKEPGMDEVLGTVAAPMSKNPVHPGEIDSPLDNWIAQMGRAYTQTPIYIHNTGGTRISLSKGPFTKRTLIDLFPFDDTFVQMTLSGRELKNFIRRNLLPWNKYVYAGLDISYHVKNGRVKNLTVLLDGKPVENNKQYVVGTNSYVARNRAFHQVADKQPSGTQTIRQVIQAALEKGPLQPPATGHIIEQ